VRIFADQHLFRVMLQGFNYLKVDDLVEIKFNKEYPNIQFMHKMPNSNNYDCIKVKNEVNDLVIKKLDNISGKFCYDSLKQAFGRQMNVSAGNKVLLVINMYEGGHLTLRHSFGPIMLDCLI